MNPKADNGWQYLRISLRYVNIKVQKEKNIFKSLLAMFLLNILFSCLCCSCASRNDMLEACDSRNLDVLQKEFPL